MNLRPMLKSGHALSTRSSEGLKAIYILSYPICVGIVVQVWILSVSILFLDGVIIERRN